jgi:metallo-beta-lactamase class B
VINISEKAILVDAPWDSAHTKQIVDFIRDSLRSALQIAIITHAHDDRIGGISELKSENIPVYGSELTTMLAKKAGIPRPDVIFNDSLILNFNGFNLLIYFPGAGHSLDNVMVWISAENVLYGGDFIKDMASSNIGNMEDADTEAWKISLEKTMKRFSDAQFIIPGHGNPGGQELIQHTMELLNKWKKP